MEVPEFIYFSNPDAQNQSRVYHTRNCNGRLDERTKVPATEANIELIRRLGFTVCKTCKLRYEKEQKRKEHALMIETYEIAALAVPDEFELRVYWHRETGQPVELWSSKTGMRP
jgi:hypothetical protein